MYGGTDAAGRLCGQNEEAGKGDSMETEKNPRRLSADSYGGVSHMKLGSKPNSRGHSEKLRHCSIPAPAALCQGTHHIRHLRVLPKRRFWFVGVRVVAEETPPHILCTVQGGKGRGSLASTMNSVRLCLIHASGAADGGRAVDTALQIAGLHCTLTEHRMSRAKEPLVRRKRRKRRGGTFPLARGTHSPLQ